MIPALVEKGIRLTLEAEDLVKNKLEDNSFLQKIIRLGKPLISKEDVERIAIEDQSLSNEKNLAEFRGSAYFNPLAKEYEGKININDLQDVTGKSRTKGEVGNFINYFRDRYSRLSKFLKRNNSSKAELSEIKKAVGQTARIIVLVSEKRETKKGNIMLDVEDMTGTFKVVISTARQNEKLVQKARAVLKDDVVAITGKVAEPYLIAEEIEWPDLPVIREKKIVEADLAIAYLSDLHFGSRYFLDKKLDSFVDWLHGKGEAREMAGKIKYIVIAGDIVDGVGVYPNQEKELVIKDIHKQYNMFEDFVERIPDYIEIIVAPGNHDAVRRGEPQPALTNDMLDSEITKIGNPSSVTIEGLKHLIYHGTSMDSMIANVPGLSYVQPEKVMVEYLKRRHLSPIYGGNLIIPENIDYLVIEDPPDVFHSGHVHKNGYTQYRGTVVINSGTFQAQTEYQIKQGHVPTPALVPVYEMKYERLKTLDFNQ